MVMSAEAKSWKRAAQLQFRLYRMRPLDGAVWVRLVLHPKITNSGAANKTRIDLDACGKLVLDAMNGIGYADDKQIERLTMEVGMPVMGGGLSVSVGKL